MDGRTLKYSHKRSIVDVQHVTEALARRGARDVGVHTGWRCSTRATIQEASFSLGERRLARNSDTITCRVRCAIDSVDVRYEM